MIRDGCLENIEEIYGLHVWNYQKIGEVGVKSGPVMAAADMFTDIEGIGGHGAAPQGTVDSIVVASSSASFSNHQQEYKPFGQRSCYGW